jgi:hypothetical protein
MARKIAAVALLAALAATGCTTVRRTDPPRAATEQLLLSTAADRAVGQMPLGLQMAGKKVFLDASQFEAIDKGYAVGVVADALGRQGALLVAERKDAEAVAALRSGALSIDRSDTLVGVPALNLPIPFAGQVETPELALVKRVSQTGLAKLALTASTSPEGKHLASFGPVTGVSRYNEWTILFIGFRTTNIPEKKPARWWRCLAP